MIAGLSRTLPDTLTSGLRQHGVSGSLALHVGGLPPVSSLFASVLGVNPVRHLLGPDAVAALAPADRAALTGPR